jgi:hypothetical protein
MQLTRIPHRFCVSGANFDLVYIPLIPSRTTTISQVKVPDERTCNKGDVLRLAPPSTCIDLRRPPQHHVPLLLDLSLPPHSLFRLSKQHFLLNVRKKSKLPSLLCLRQTIFDVKIFSTTSRRRSTT